MEEGSLEAMGAWTQGTPETRKLEERESGGNGWRQGSLEEGSLEAMARDKGARRQESLVAMEPGVKGAEA